MVNKIIKIESKWHWLVLFLLAISFFVGTSSFNWLTQIYSPNGSRDFVKWASPDETANYIFTKLYGQTGRLSFFEKYNLIAEDIIHPRSFRSDYGWLKPVSFLGLPLLYGKIVHFTTYKILPYLTPFFAALGLIYYYLLIKKIFGRANAWLSVWFLAFFPPFIYYSARSLFHNVLFVVLVIIGLYYLVGSVRLSKKQQQDMSFRRSEERATEESFEASKRWRWVRLVLRIIAVIRLQGFFIPAQNKKTKKSWRSLFFAALAGGFFGLAVGVRASELLWLAPLLFVLWLLNCRRFGLLNLICFLSFFFFALLPIFYHNQILYGSFYYGGYPEMNRSIENIASASAGLVKTAADGKWNFLKENLRRIKNNVFYFGFHPQQAVKIFKYYFIDMFPFLAAASLVGLALLIREGSHIKRRQAVYLAGYFLISLILLFYYGSWQFYDNPDPASRTIGNSYTRYWLPIYLGALPLASLSVICLSRVLADGLIRLWPIRFFKIRQNFLAGAIRAVFIIVLAFFSLRFVLIGSAEGLFFLAQRQKAAQSQWQTVLGLTEPNAVIITRYHDKLFFPERKVIVGLFDDKNMVAIYSRLINYLPVYYYNFTLPEDSINYLNNRRLAEVGLRIEKIKSITPDFSLYKLKKNYDYQSKTKTNWN